MITIKNSGQDIAETNYWVTEHASRGFCYLSANAGAWRLLVPKNAEAMIAEMRTGTRAAIEPSMHAPGKCWDVVFQDGTDSPFSLAVDKKQCDRAVEPGYCRLTVWTNDGKVLDLACQITV